MKEFIQNLVIIIGVNPLATTKLRTIKDYKYLILCAILCLIISSCGANQISDDAIAVSVKRVISGQTIEVIMNNKPVKIRLSGIEIPKIANHQSTTTWREEAKQELVKLLTNNYQQTLNQITLQLELAPNFEQENSSQFLQGYLWHEGKLINQQIIKQGLAIANLNYTEGKYDQQLILAQEYARMMENGVWNPQKSIVNALDKEQLTVNNQ